MKIAVDTNVLFSMIFYRSPAMQHMMEFIIAEHELLVFDYVANELIDAAARKKPMAIHLVHAFLETISMVQTGDAIARSNLVHRDPKDQPILDAALSTGVDIIITGDKGFHALKIEKPRMMYAADFITEFLAQSD